MKTGRPYMSIGEVLGVLQPEFPDVTVSKIRFLESEGLIDPERTASGYRKFYQRDLDRLRFILALQRDSYLPLKVIRERLAEFDAGLVSAADPAPVASPGGNGSSAEAPAASSEPPARGPRPEVDVDEELAESATVSQVSVLQEFGVICSHGMNGDRWYDQDDLIVGRIARDFLRFGVEARHLKMFRHFAEREADLFEQIVLPSLRNRSPETRKQATQSLSELARLSKKIRHAFLRQNLRAYLAGDR
ncbi:MAG: MerR family transcriptional regulator [Actinobacteria bacterium]|nr:MAG: MerR family transcriptional regulator [Actinomycetota bacterium]